MNKKNQKDDIINIKNQAKEMIKIKKYGEAEKCINFLLGNMDSKNIDLEVYSMCSSLFLAQGLVNEAEEVINYGLNVDLNNCKLNYSLGQLNEYRGYGKAALSSYRKAFYSSNDDQFKNSIINHVENIKEIGKYEVDPCILLDEDVQCNSKILLVCNFYSVYTEQYILQMGKRMNVKFDILTPDTQYENELISEYVDNIFIYSSVEELDEIFGYIGKYDIIHIHYLYDLYCLFTDKLKGLCHNLMITIWGSDFYKADMKQKVNLKQIVDKADKISFDNEQTLNEFVQFYGRDVEDKTTICRFGLTMLDYIDKVTSLDVEKYKSMYKIPKDAYVITCGYNADICQHHLEIIESLNDCNSILNENIYYLFPMTYKRDEEYVELVRRKLESSKLNYRIIEDFMDFKEMALLTRATDIFIQLQETDTLSATMQENLYAGNIVITGSWLPYQCLKQEGANFYTVDDVKDISQRLESLIKGSLQNKKDFEHNKEIISSYSCWDSTYKQWYDLYNSCKKNISKKVLVVAYFFPPVGGAGVQRTLKYVKYLRDFGYEPIVLTCGRSNYFAEDQSLLNELPKDIRVLRVDDVENSELTDEFLSDMIEKSMDMVEDKEYVNQFIERIQTSSEYLNNNILLPDSYMPWAKKVIDKVETLLNMSEIDIVYTTSSPYSDHVIGYYLKKIYGKPWIVDFRDEWTNNPYIEYDVNDIRYKIEKSMEKKILDSCNKVIVVTEYMRQNYIEKFKVDKEKIIEITNGFDEEDFIFNMETYKKEEEFCIMHNGFIYGQRLEATEMFIRAIKELIDNKLIDKNKIKLIFSRSEGDEALIDIAKKYDMYTNCMFLGYMDHLESLSRSLSMDCLFLPIGKGEEKKSIYTGKIFEYLRMCKPIISLSPAGGLVEKLLVDTQRGYNCEMDDVESIKSTVLRLYSKWYQGSEDLYPLTKIKKFDRRHLTNKLSQVLNDVIFDSSFKIDSNFICRNIEKGMYLEAIRLCKRYLKFNGEDGNIVHYLAVAYNGIKDFEKAYHYHTRSIQLAPGLADIKNGEYLGQTFYDEREMSCLGCGNDEHEIVWIGNQSALYSNYGLVNPIRKWVRCSKCGLVYANPAPSEESYNLLSNKLSEIETSDGFYAVDDYFELNVEVANGRIANIEKHLGKRGKLLDVGAGFGTFVGVARDRGWDATGLEFSSTNCAYAETNYGERLLNKNFYDFEDNIKYDVITLFEVIEHLWSPKKDIRKLNSLLNMGGVLVIATPNLTSLFSRKYKEFSMFWYMSCHLSFFSREVLSDYLKECGFEILEYNISREGKGRMEVYAKKVRAIEN